MRERRKARRRALNGRADPRRAEPASERALPSVARTVSDALTHPKDAVWSMEEVQAFTVERVMDVLRSRRVPKARIQSPLMDIAVPGIEAMRYSRLRAEFANLIAASMDKRHAHEVLPAYLSVLKQLSLDEVRLIAAWPGAARAVPVAHINAEEKDGQSAPFARNLLPKKLTGLCDHPANVPRYIDNLLRLAILHRPEDVDAPDAAIYREIVEESSIDPKRRLRGRASRTLRVHGALIALTDFGEGFRSACLAV